MGNITINCETKVTGNLIFLMARETEYEVHNRERIYFWGIESKEFMFFGFVFFFFVFFPFLGPLLRHMEVPRLGVQSEP